MKCLVLAGGSGDRMWPMSRRNYPKQFIEIQKGRSIFQETIARNMAFCDEFLIITNKDYQFIVEGQLKAFQGIRYRLFLEEIPRKTTAAISLICLYCVPSELIFVVPSDQLAAGHGYIEAVLRAKELAKEGYLVTFGMKISRPDTRFGYIHNEGEAVLEFTEKPDKKTAEKFMNDSHYLWNSGLFLFHAGDLLNELKRYTNNVYVQCVKVYKKLRHESNYTIVPSYLLEYITPTAIERTVFEKSKKVKVVTRDFSWRDIGTLEDLDMFIDEKDTININQHKNHITYNSTNTIVINQSDRQLVVANHLDNLTIVNTEDAVYIGNKDDSDNLKAIVKNHPEFSSYFDDNRVVYKPWGTREFLSKSEEYSVKKVIIFPEKTIYAHKHNYRSEHWSIVQGQGRIILEDSVRSYHANDNIDVPIGITHQVSNTGNEPLVIIEVAIGKIVSETDIISMSTRDLTDTDLGLEMDAFVKLSPIYKDYLWGGTRLREQYDKICDYDIIAESWELSAHEAGQSIISSGRHDGITLGEYLNKIGKQYWGWKCQTMDKFPILIKLLDARESLSIQVHPNDEYALEVENEYGKNEMWYIADAKENSGIYCGFIRETNPAEVRTRILDNTILEILNWIPVKKGDVFFINAGTVHAIGKDILICEIQQSSNCTYRLYDFGRRDRYGNLRELHLDKALDVIDYSPYLPIPQNDTPDDVNIESFNYFELLVTCKYFECKKYVFNGELTLEIGPESFCALLCIDGQGELSSPSQNLSFRMGECIFIPAKKEFLKIHGQGEFLLAYV